MPRLRIRLPLSVVLCCATVTYGEVITNQVGDVDAYHPGDAPDTPYRSTAVLDKMNQGSYALIAQRDLDDDSPGTVGFTHAFEMIDASQVISAVLQIHVRPVGSLARTDWLTFDNGNATYTPGSPIVHHLSQVVALVDLVDGWVLPAEGRLFEVDLMNAPYRTQDLVASTEFQGGPTGYMNLVPYLEDGELDVITWDDVAVDYSVLQITLVPEPSSALLVGTGILALIRRNRR